MQQNPDILYDRQAIEMPKIQNLPSNNAQNVFQNQQQQQNKIQYLQIIRDYKDYILQLSEQEIGEFLKNDLEFLINNFYQNSLYEEKRNSLIIIVYILYFLRSIDTSNQIIKELNCFLSQDENQLSGVSTIQDLKLLIKNDQQICGSLLKFLSIYKIGYLMKPFIKDMKLNLENVDKLTSSLLIQNNNLDAINYMLSYQNDALNQQELDKTKNIIFSILEKRYAEYKYFQSSSILCIRQFSLISMFEVFFESNFENLWQGMLKYLKNFSQIESGTIFVLQKKTIQDAIKYRRLDFVVQSLLHYRQDTEKILQQEDVFFSLIPMINETKYFSDIICILSQFYKQIKSRKQQEYLIEIFTMMLNNNCPIVNSQNILSNGHILTNSVHQIGHACRSVHTSPKSIKNLNQNLLESQVYCQDLQKFNINLSYLFYTLSPIITCTIIAKIFYILSQKFNSPLKLKLKQVALEYLNLSIAFSQEVEDLRQWKLLLFDIIYPARFTLIQITINYKEFFSPLLSLNNIKNTLFTKWKSEYNFSYNILACSSQINLFKEIFWLQSGQIKDLPPFVPAENITDLQGKYYQNFQMMQSQPIIDENSLRNAILNNDNFQKMNGQKRVMVQQDFQIAFSQAEDQDSERQKELQIKQRLVGNSQFQDLQKKPRFPNLSKMCYFLQEGITCVKESNLKNDYYFYQQIVIERSVMMRNILEFIFFIILFLLCFIYSLDFINQYINFQKISSGYLQLYFKNTPPDQYLQSWTQTCSQFQSNPQVQQARVLINSIPNKQSYQEFCQLLVQYQSCGVQQIYDLFLNDCQYLEQLLVAMNELSVTPKIFFGLFTSYALYLIQLLSYHILIKKRRYVFGFFEFVDLVITILAALIVWHMDSNLNPYLYISKQFNQNDLNNNCEIFKNLLMFFFLVLWVRLFRYARKTQKFGKIIKIFELVVRDMIWFLIIIFLVIAASSMFFYIGFGYAYSEYNSFAEAYLQLFSSIFSSFTLNGKRMDTQLYLIIFLIIFNIIVINTLIAVLSNNYKHISRQANMEYSLLLYDEYIKLKKNDIYGSTFYFPPPLNVINFIFTPLIYIFPKYSTLINKISFHISYFILMISFIALFICLQALLIIPSYITTFFQIIFNINNCFTLRTVHRIFLSILWLAVGIPILLIQIFVNDFPLFVKSCFFPLNKKKIQKIFEIDQYEKVNIQFLKNILKKIRSKTKKKALLSLSCFNASVYTHVPCQSNFQSLASHSPSFAGNANAVWNINNNQQAFNYPNTNTKYMNKFDTNNSQTYFVENQNNAQQEKIEQMPQNGNSQQNNQAIVKNYPKYPQNKIVQQEQSQATLNQNQQTNQGNENQYIDLSYKIKVSPPPILDQNNKIVDSVTTTIDDTLNTLKIFVQADLYNKQEDIIQAQNSQNNQTVNKNTKHNPQQPNLSQFNNYSKAKKNPLKYQNQDNQIFSQNANSNLNNQNTKNERAYPILFIETAQEENQANLQGIDDESFFEPKRSNSQQNSQINSDILTTKKVTEMYYQEVIEQQKQKNLLSIAGQKKVGSVQEVVMLQSEVSQILQTEEIQSSGLWLELFLKRTSYQANNLKYSMLLQFLLDARKSTCLIQAKSKNVKKQLEKQSELISLVDVQIGKRVVSKFLQNNQSLMQK
ncbi:hypothetical protein ABPG74_000206 [Tetrahymena malaccensis]